MIIRKLHLLCHDDAHARAINGVSASIIMTAGNDVRLGFSVYGDVERLIVPNMHDHERADGLWNTTCFEMFIRHDHCSDYLEYNFSPSSQWAAYSFENYRSGMAEPKVTDRPSITYERHAGHIDCEIILTLSGFRVGTLHIALSAVIEEVDGTKSYWALRHPPGAPDFHHPDCFALNLGAPSE